MFYGKASSDLEWKDEGKRDYEKNWGDNVQKFCILI